MKRKILKAAGPWAGPAVLLVFGLWHLLDARTAAAAVGGSWLLIGYVLLLAAVLSGAVLFYRLFAGNGRGLSLERVYPAAALFLGVLYMLVLPPLSAPDEISHYVSAYQLSSRMLGAPSNDQYGYVLVRSRDWAAEDVYGSYRYEVGDDGYLRQIGAGDEGPVVLGQTLTATTAGTLYGSGGSLEARGRQLEEEAPLAVSPYPPVNTTPAAYVPQAIGISLARLLGLGSTALLFLGRLCNLLFFTGLTWLAMRRLPFGKEVLFGTALLPMTLHLSASFSYDVLIMGCMFWFTAVCLDLAYRQERVRVRDVVLLAALMAAAGPCKMVYASLMGLCLLIPVKKFGGWKTWLLAAAAVAGAWAAVMVLVNGQTIALYAAETEKSVPWAAQEAGYSLSYVLRHPRETAALFYSTLLWQLEEYHMTMIGAYLGNLDPVLSVPYGVVLLFTGALLLLALRKPEEPVVLSGGRRIWVFAVCGLCAAALMGSMLIAWTAMSSPVISGVQGRYFLPFLPVLLMAVKNRRLILTKDGNRSILYLMCCANGYVLLRLYATVALRL